MKLLEVKIFFFLICCLFLYQNKSVSQKGSEAGFWLGTANYFGDLNNLYRMNEPGLAGGGIFKYNLDERISLRTGLSYARLRGHDSKSNNSFDRKRNLSFFGDVVELAPAIEFNFFELKHGSNQAFYSPYLFGGMSVFYYNPKAKLNGEVFNLRQLGTEGQVPGQEYSSISGAWLIGGGFKMDISYRWCLQFEIGYRASFTDYLDDVSKVYPNFGTLESDRGKIAVLFSDRSIKTADSPEIAVPGFQRGDAKDRDAFVTMGLNLIYYFGSVRCPGISDF